ncbi:polymer-forming cytoskeletal protein [Patescibacteria group bacterium]|nr:polymer-forming cytoskeletal protein [Patescibacteria group bacterium]
MFKEENPAKDIKSAETIIGPSVRVEGDFNSEHDIIIDGEVVGNISTANNLRIGKGAVVKAKIDAKNAYISGKVIGNVSVKDKLKITESATIKGNVSAKILEVEPGASLIGQCKVTSVPESKAPEKIEKETK